MPRLERTFALAVPEPQVFAVIADPLQLAACVEQIRHVRLIGQSVLEGGVIERSLQVAASYKDAFSWHGEALHRLDAAARQVWLEQTDNPYVPARVAIRVTEGQSGRGTTAKVRLDYQPASPVVAMLLALKLERALGKLVRRVEARARGM
jgi:hypothetical protein